MGIHEVLNSRKKGKHGKPGGRPKMGWTLAQLRSSWPSSEGQANWTAYHSDIQVCIYNKTYNSNYIYVYTSSTAQGGGGSFKNGKPIGEVSWCDAKMAERTHWWIERWLSVSAFLSLFLSFSLCLSFAIYLQSYLSSHLPIYLSIHVSIDRFVYSPIY